MSDILKLKRKSIKEIKQSDDGKTLIITVNMFDSKSRTFYHQDITRPITNIIKSDDNVYFADPEVFAAIDAANKAAE